MVQITSMDEEGRNVCLKVEGRLVGKWVSKLGHTCIGFLIQDKVIVLDLADVSFIDRRGVEVLRKMPTCRVQILKASLSVQTLLGH